MLLPWQSFSCSAPCDVVDVHFIRATFRQKFLRLSVPPKSVVKLVESTSTTSPARCISGGIHSRQLNSVLPAAVKGCGRSRSMGWRASTCTDMFSVEIDVCFVPIADLADRHRLRKTSNCRRLLRVATGRTKTRGGCRIAPDGLGPRLTIAS